MRVPQKNTPGFFARVYAVAALIPPGKVMTYGQIADVLGNECSARYVGYALASVPAHADIPCHRVLNKAGEMAKGDIFGGAAMQRRRLESEGALFLPDGRVDLAACRFIP